MAYAPSERERSATLLNTPFHRPIGGDASQSLSLAFERIRDYQRELRYQRAREDDLIEDLKRHRRRQDAQFEMIVSTIKQISYTTGLDQLVEEGLDEAVHSLRDDSVDNSTVAHFEDTREEARPTVEADNVLGRYDDDNPFQSPVAGPSNWRPQRRGFEVHQYESQRGEPGNPLTSRSCNVESTSLSPPVSLAPTEPEGQPSSSKALVNPPNAAPTKTPTKTAPTPKPHAPKSLGKRKKRTDEDEDAEWQPPKSPARARNNPPTATAGLMGPPPRPPPQRQKAIASMKRTSDLLSLYSRGDRAVSKSLREDSVSPIVTCYCGKSTCRICMAKKAASP